MKKIHLAMIVSLALSPTLSLGQEEPTLYTEADATTTMEVVVDEQATTSEEIVVEEETTVNDTDSTTTDEEVMTEEEVQDMIDESAPVDEETVVVEGEVIATEDGVVYVQTDDGVVSIDTTDPVNDNVIIRTGGGKRNKNTIVVSSGDKITVTGGNEVTISQELTGKIVRIVNDMITIALADGTEKTVRVNSNASYVNVQGEKKQMSQMQVGDDVTVAADENDDAYQVITGEAEELQELRDGTSEDDSFPYQWAIWLGVALAAVLAWFTFKK